MITWPWVQGRSSAALDIDDFPDVKAWHARVGAREAVRRAMAQAQRVHRRRAAERRPRARAAARSVLFGQAPRT